MRETYHKILKLYFNKKLVRAREELNLTQSQMARMLAMDDRSYADLEHGKTCCSAVTLALFLIYICDDVSGFLQELRHDFETGRNRVA